jgi:hypothetical protein
VLFHKPVARRVVQYWETPRVSKRNEMGFTGEVVDREGFKPSYLLLRYGGIVYLPPQLRIEDGSPNQEASLVSAPLEIGHEAFDDMRLGREKVYSVHSRVHLPPLLDSLDVCSSRFISQGGQGRFSVVD